MRALRAALLALPLAAAGCVVPPPPRCARPGLRAFGSDVSPPGCASSSCALPLAAGLPVVAPRVLLDQWIGRRFSISAWLTADALHLPDFGAGVSLGVHPWAYDGLP